MIFAIASAITRGTKSYAFKMSAYVNAYAPPEGPETIPGDVHATTHVEQYDFNFIFPVIDLKSDRVELRPFIVSALDIQRSFVIWE